MINDILIEPRNPVRRYRHGHKDADGGTREYHAWNAMRSRCNNPWNPNFARYGARGIRVCERWQSDFTAFLQDMGRCPSGQHSIERIDNDGDYAPENCRWATPKEQARNRRSSRLLSYRGATRTAAEWAEVIGITQGTLHARLKEGWSVERALTQPLRRISRKAAVIPGVDGAR